MPKRKISRLVMKVGAGLTLLTGLLISSPQQLCAVDVTTLQKCGSPFDALTNPNLVRFLEQAANFAAVANGALSAGDVDSFNLNLILLGNATMQSIFQVAIMADNTEPIGDISGNPSRLACLRDNPGWSEVFSAVNQLVVTYYSLLVQGAATFGSDSVTVADQYFARLLLPVASNNVITTTSFSVYLPPGFFTPTPSDPMVYWLSNPDRIAAILGFLNTRGS